MKNPPKDRDPSCAASGEADDATSNAQPKPAELHLVDGLRTGERHDGEDDEASSEASRAHKVAEARIKILNGYYSRSDVQKELAERLIFELGA